MKTSAAGIALIERFEGLKLRAYRDGNGIWTIGYGHTGAGHMPAVTCGQFETQAQAEADLCGDLGDAEAAVTRLATVPMTQGEFDGLVAFARSVPVMASMPRSLLRTGSSCWASA